MSSSVQTNSDAGKIEMNLTCQLNVGLPQKMFELSQFRYRIIQFEQGPPYEADTDQESPREERIRLAPSPLAVLNNPLPQVFLTNYQYQLCPLSSSCKTIF